MTRKRRTSRALLAMVLLALCAAPPATGFDHTKFGLSGINDGPGPLQEVPALPDATHAFWAGTCDRASAPAPGSPIDGGIGTLPTTVWAPLPQVPHRAVAAPATAAHCIEWGVPSDGNDLPWMTPPSWRLPAHAQAGGHPDGSSNFVLNRSGSGLFVDGSLDNIVVDLPPGFVADPTAVPRCPAEAFRQNPLRCPPESQVGVLHLEIQVPFLGGENSHSGNERIYPVYNVEPRRGNAAELGFGYASGESAVTVRIVGKARTNSDFGVSAWVGQIPAALQVRSQQITLWGVPWAARNDIWRAPVDLAPRIGNNPANCNFQPADAPYDSETYIPPSGLTAPGCAERWRPSWGPIRPFISNLTECTGQGLSTRLAIDQFQEPGGWTSDGRLPDPVSGKFGFRNGDPALPPYPALPGPGSTNWRVHSSPAPPMEGCDAVPFDTNFDLRPTTSDADSATGLSVDLNVPQNDDPPIATPAPDADQATIDAYVADATAHWKSDAGLATAHLDKAVVTLPDGFTVNPSAAGGLDGCSDAGIGVRQQGNPPLFNNGDPFDGSPADGAECPLSSIIGEVDVDVPLLDEPLRGHVVLGSPKSTDPMSGEMFRMFIVVKDGERGVIGKIYGSAVADPGTGKITATFDENPRVPFEHMHIEFKRGGRAILATPQRCGRHGWSSTFTPWTAAHGAGGQPVPVSDDMTTDRNCAFDFAPGLESGMDRAQGGDIGGKFTFRFTRPDGQQWLRGLTAELPQGLLASVRNVPLCKDAQAAAGACPDASRIATVDAAAGAGNPFFLERKGDMYLTEGYKGGPYGLMVRVPVEAGPFRGDMALSPIVVRQAIHVDRTTAQVTAVSDPFPLIHHGVPLRVREVTVLVDRPDFMRNPTDCSPKQVKGTFTSAENAQSTAARPFQVRGCRALRFQPKLRMRLTGRRQVTTGKHPGIRSVVTQRSGEAGIKKAVVRLPKSLALDPNNAQALCEFEDGIKPDLERHCPRASIVGRARAVSPLLNDPLVGNVYFVKNIRIDPQTGNQIRTLPMIIAALRGEIAVNVRGLSDTTEGGKLVSTFNTVPDAPVSRFNLNVDGGRNGIIAVTRTRRGLINICRGRHVAEAEMDGFNGKRHDRNVRLGTPCKRRGKGSAQRRSANKRKAARAGARARR